MENRTLAKLYVQAKKEKNYKKNTQYQEQILAIEGFSEEVDGVIINHEKIYMDIFDIKIDVMLSVDVHAKKPNKEVLNKKIDQLNELLSKFSDETRKTVYEKLAKCYSDVAAIYKPYKKNQEAITALLNKALDAGIPASCLSDFIETYKAGLDEETFESFSKLYNDTVAVESNEKVLKDLEQVLPNYEYVGLREATAFAPNSMYVVNVEPDQSLCIELFKNHLEQENSITQEEKAILTDSNAKIEIELFYYPLVFLKWNEEPSRYRYVYKREYYSGGVTTTSTNTGSFNYGGGTITSRELAGMIISGKSVGEIADCEVNYYDMPKETASEGKYIAVDKDKQYFNPYTYALRNSFGRSNPLYEAKAAICKELGVSSDSYNVTVEKIESGRITYDPITTFYVPMFGIKISNNNYVAKGVINAYDNSKVAITSLGKIDENGFYQSLQKEKSESAGKYKPKKKSFFSKLFLILSIIATGFGIYKSFLLDDLPAKIVFVLPAILSLIFSIIGVKKPHRKIGKVCIVLAFIALLAFVGICFMAGGNIGCSGNGEAVNPGFFLIR